MGTRGALQPKLVIRAGCMVALLTGACQAIEPSSGATGHKASHKQLYPCKAGFCREEQPLAETEQLSSIDHPIKQDLFLNATIANRIVGKAAERFLQGKTLQNPEQATRRLLAAVNRWKDYELRQNLAGSSRHLTQGFGDFIWSHGDHLAAGGHHSLKGKQVKHVPRDIDSAEISRAELVRQERYQSHAQDRQLRQLKTDRKHLLAGEQGRLWDGPYKEIEVCDNSCPSAENGVCEDGRTGNKKQVLCDLGTDCADCGSWNFTVRASETEKDIPKPIQAILAMDIEVLTSKTKTVPQFMMPYTTPWKDVDVSSYVHNTGVIELGLSQAMHMAMRNKKCVHSNGTREVFLDVGANFGWYSYYAAAHGCRVIGWEPVPEFRNFFIYGRQLNHLEELIHIRDRVVSDQADEEVEITVPRQGIWGTASVNSFNIDKSTNAMDQRHMKVMTERVDDVYEDKVLLTKIDIEGYEPQAVRSMKGLIEHHRVHMIALEYSPGTYERNQRWSELDVMPSMLSFLLSQGYRIGHFTDVMTRNWNLLGTEDWTDDIGPMMEVANQSIAYDLVDAYKISQRGNDRCWDDGLRALNDVWKVCTSLTEDLHPKGFRGTFGHNTNIMASLEPNIFKYEGYASLHPPESNPQNWYGPKPQPQLGLGPRECIYAPIHLRVKARCPCRPGEEECRQEAALILQLMKQGGPLSLSQKNLILRGLELLQN